MVNFRAFGFGVALVVLVIGGTFTGCSNIGGGLPHGQTQVRITGHSRPEIETKAEEVFFRHGFDFRGAGPERMEFERRGGTLENALYGNWTSQDTNTRVTLFITQVDPLTYDLRVRSIVVRDSFGGDSDARHFDVSGGRYRTILRKIRNELN